jgi:hypothetical protein
MHIHGYEIVRRDRNLNSIDGVVVFVFIHEVALIFRYDTIWNLMSWKIYAFQSIN